MLLQIHLEKNVTGIIMISTKKMGDITGENMRRTLTMWHWHAILKTVISAGIWIRKTCKLYKKIGEKQLHDTDCMCRRPIRHGVQQAALQLGYGRPQRYSWQNGKCQAKAAVIRAFHHARRLQKEKGSVSCPEELGGSVGYYLYPVFLRIGVCTKK